MCLLLNKLQRNLRQYCLCERKALFISFQVLWIHEHSAALWFVLTARVSVTHTLHVSVHLTDHFFTFVYMVTKQTLHNQSLLLILRVLPQSRRWWVPLCCLKASQTTLNCLLLWVSLHVFCNYWFFTLTDCLENYISKLNTYPAVWSQTMYYWIKFKRYSHKLGHWSLV